MRAAYIGQEVFVSRVLCTGKHGFLPDEESHFICKVIQSVILVQASSPDAYHVHVGLDSILKKVAIPILGVL